MISSLVSSTQQQIFAASTSFFTTISNPLLANKKLSAKELLELYPDGRIVAKDLKYRKPVWLRSSLPTGKMMEEMKSTVHRLKLNTVCEEAKCPNIGECWNGSGGKHGEMATATVMLMGDTCTRACRFCSVKTARHPPPLNPDEPKNTAKAIREWGLDYVVLTTVDRDDLEDFGANHFARTVELIKDNEDGKQKEIFVECLTGDFQGKKECVERMLNSGLDVFAHNVETTEEMTKTVRDRRATYKTTLKVLEMAKELSFKTKKDGIVTKTSLMLGIGETDDQVIKTMKDLRSIGVDCITFGQYLQPTTKQLPVIHYVHPEKFRWFQEEGEKMGFKFVASGPFVRSSYRAGELYLKKFLKHHDTKEIEEKKRKQWKKPQPKKIIKE